jgi:two-component system, response regulator PdtaR
MGLAVQNEQSDLLDVIVTEDEPIVAWELENTLSSLGCRVAGPFPSVHSAIAALSNCAPKIAVLDVNLQDGEVFPLADRLYENEVLLIFHTVNICADLLASRYAGSQVVLKPSRPEQLREAIALAKSRFAG